jgi:SAM-dependent methyltransferase
LENASQIEFWNAKQGKKWRENQQSLDTLLGGVSTKLLEICEIGANMNILDIGCGTGALALELSDRLDGDGTVTAVDVSTPLLDTAQQRAIGNNRTNISFLLADAQTHNFSPQSADLMISRFGVMFFEDPAAAFANILSAMQPGAPMIFAAWSHLEDNPWFKIPRDAAVKQLGKPDPAPATAPGPTAFADLKHVGNIMRIAKINHVESKLENIPLVVNGNATVAASLACSIGPVTRIAKAKGASEEDLQIIEAQVYEKLKPYENGGQVVIPSHINFFTCRGS